MNETMASLETGTREVWAKIPLKFKLMGGALLVILALLAFSGWWSNWTSGREIKRLEKANTELKAKEQIVLQNGKAQPQKK